MTDSISFSLKPKHVLLFAFALLIFTSCAEVVSVEIISGNEPYGFWNGLWHGIIAPVAFVISLFKDSVAMYAINNTGAWYDFGFLFGISMSLGGGCKAGCKKRK